MYILLQLIIYCSVSGVLSNSLITPCKVGDQPCLDKLANDLKPIMYPAVPEFGVESSDPLFAEIIEGETASLKYKLINSTFIGLSNCTISNFIFSNDLTKFQFDLDCPQFNASGKYEMNGQLITLPVDGKGDFELITGNYFLHYESDMEVTEYGDGIQHIYFKNFKLKLEPKTAIKLDFKNLYNGQKELSDAFHKILHENWRVVAESVQDRIWYICMEKIVNNINMYLKIAPLDNFIII